MDGLCHAADMWFDDERFTWYQYAEGDIDTSKPANCPLVELPPHGRLIDGDVLTERLERGENSSLGRAHAYYRFAKAWINESKTIIEAEGEP